MFRFQKNLRNQVRSAMNTCRSYNSFKVAVIGSSRPLGQSVSMLLKQNPLVHNLAMFDFCEETHTIGMDLTHIPKEPIVENCMNQMGKALPGSDLVLVTGGQPKREGQTDLCLFQENADFIITAMEEIAANCPDAFVAITTEPINYIVPLASKVLKSNYAYNRSKVLGVTVLDTIRSHALVSNLYQIPWHDVKIPVICGHSSKTVVPLLSHLRPKLKVDDTTASTITEAIRTADDKIISFIGNSGQSTPSATYATFCTASAILNALNGYAVEHVAFVANNNYNTKFFSSPLVITSKGVSETTEYVVQTALEETYMVKAMEELASEVRSGELYCTAVKVPSNEKIKMNYTFN